MEKKKSEAGFTLVELLVVGLVVALVAAIFLVGGYAVQYVVEFWSTYLKHQPVHISFWLCCFASLFMGELPIPLAVLTFIFSLVL